VGRKGIYERGKRGTDGCDCLWWGEATKGGGERIKHINHWKGRSQKRPTAAEKKNLGNGLHRQLGGTTDSAKHNRTGGGVSRTKQNGGGNQLKKKRPALLSRQGSKFFPHKAPTPPKPDVEEEGNLRGGSKKIRGKNFRGKLSKSQQKTEGKTGNAPLLKKKGHVNLSEKFLFRRQVAIRLKTAGEGWGRAFRSCTAKPNRRLEIGCWKGPEVAEKDSKKVLYNKSKTGSSSSKVHKRGKWVVGTDAKRGEFFWERKGVGHVGGAKFGEKGKKIGDRVGTQDAIFRTWGLRGSNLMRENLWTWDVVLGGEGCIKRAGLP